MRATDSSPTGLLGFAHTILEAIERVPVALPELVLRLGISLVFYRSFRVKIADWNTTLLLFENEYRVPLLPPEVAAILAAGVEIAGPVMLVLGFGTRAAAAAMLGMTLVIQFFVYPQSYPDHLLWAGPLLYLLLRGPGKWSVDAVLRDGMGDRQAGAAQITPSADTIRNRAP
jgi:putative oxidoreductase